MKKLMRRGMRSSFFVVLVLILAAAARADDSRYVVTLAQTATMDAESLAATYGGKVLRVIDEVTIEVEVPSSRAKLFSRDTRVLGMRASNFRVATSGWTSAMSFTYDAAGNVRQIGSDTFAYDDVDRVVSATVSSGTETFTTETFTYDAYGNRTGCTNVSAGNSACQTVTIASGTNRISGMSYDAMGNLEQGGIYAYDSVGMLKRDTATGASREYLYTADDERLAVVVGGTSWTWTLRDLSGKVLREYTSTSSSGNHSNWTWMRDNVYRNGQMLSSLQPGGNGATVTWHYHLDHLGTPRVLSSTTGTILAVHDYGAFGTEISGNAAEAPLSRMKYTGHERDTFNNPSNPLDYMHARYYSASWGRFLSVDPVLDQKAAVRSPQMWNRYAYVRDNPVSFVDPDGRLAIPWHLVITTLAARAAGKSITESIRLGIATALVDVRKGSQGTDARATNGHAMRGIKPNGTQQTVAEGQAGTARTITNSMAQKDLPAALHAVQDLATPLHRDKVWNGAALNFETFQHYVADTLPSPVTVIGAFVNTVLVIKLDEQVVAKTGSAQQGHDDD